jgi:hypothetical protein
LWSQTFSSVQPYDPSVCAAACVAKTAANKAAQNSSGIYDTCYYFNAYVLYKNGAGGVFTCNFYSQPLDASAATNTGSKDAKSNLYTPGFSFAYTLNPVYGVIGTGLTYYQYDEPYNYYNDLGQTYTYPTLAPFQGSNYISTGISPNPGAINYGWGGLPQLPGQAPFAAGSYPTNIALTFKGFFIAPAAGTYTFSTPKGIDDEFYLYHGDNALSGWNKDNFDSHCTWSDTDPYPYALSSSTYSITLAKGYILPILILWTNTAGPGAIYFKVTLPDGTVKDDVTGLFTPVNPTNNPFLFAPSSN